jgi:dihydroorotase
MMPSPGIFLLVHAEVGTAVSDVFSNFNEAAFV